MSLDGDELTVAALADGYSGAIKVGVGDTVRKLRAGESTSFALDGSAPRSVRRGDRAPKAGRLASRDRTTVEPA